MPDNTRKKESPIEPFKWQPGVSGNPIGRPKGARSKLGEAFLEALASDFEENGITAIADARKESPLGYVRVCASLLPTEVQVKTTSAFDEMSLDELRKFTESLRSVLTGPGAVAASGITAEEAQAGVIQPVH
jgi:hypothetical protein